MKSKVPLIKQHDEKDCAAASLCMLLAYYGKRVSLVSAREAVQVDMYGASIYGLQKGAEHFGLIATAYQGNVEDVFEVLKENSSLPCVIRIVNNYGFEHFVVVEHLDGTTLHICDPGDGRKSYSFERFSEQFLGQIILFEKSKCFISENRTKGSLHRFTKLISDQKCLLLTISFLSLIVTVIGMAGAFFFQYLIDNVLHNISDSAIDDFAIILTGLAILYVCRFISELIRGRLLCTMSQRMNLSLVLGCAEHLTELPMRFFDTHKTGEILSRYEDASKVTEALSSATLTLLIDSLLTIGCGFILYKESPTLFVISFVIFSAYLMISICFIKPLEKFNRKMMENNSQLTSYLKQSIDGPEPLKICQAEIATKDKTKHLFTQFIKSNIKGSMLQLSKESLTDLITSIGTLAILWCGALLVITKQMTLGELITFYTLLTYFLSPIESILGLQSQIQAALVSADRLNDILDSKVEESGTLELDNDIQKIEFNNVCFRYGNRETVLNNINFSAKRGEEVALVGESGSGKSTISKLLLGLYHCEAGKIKINNHSIEEYSIDSLRRQIAYVPQTVYLFSDTIKNNLLLGISEDKLPSDEKIEQILNICKCDFVKEQPFGIYSVLEENGSNLSGGQRQRLAIARALLRNPNLLIMDEATSALDSIAESSIQSSLKKYFPNLIVISIAHRLSTIKEANHILVLDHGKVIENGTHKELSTKSTLYSKMWHKQNTFAA